MKPVKVFPRIVAFFIILLAMTACNMGRRGPAPSDSAPPTPAATENQSGNAAPAGDLSAAEMLQIERASFAAYPWRMDETILIKDTQQTISGLVEAQSSTRVHTQSVQTIASDQITIDAILIDPDLYMKGTGGPPVYYQQFGATEGQWMKVPPGSPLAEFANLARLAADPEKLIETLATGFASVFQQSDPNQKLFKMVGSESVNGVATNIYEYQGPTATYRWWIGTADQRIYKMTSDAANNTTTITVQYDPGIDIQPPV
jgi:hypothetical protein